jgi:hypothetical protein
VTINESLSGLPEDIEMLEFAHRSVRGGMPLAIRPSGIFYPDSIIIQKKIRGRGGVFQNAGD